MSINLRFFLRLAPARLGAPLALLAAGTAPAADVAPPTHVLFMGAELAMEKDKVFHAVTDVTESALVIKPGDKTVELPLARSRGIRVTETLRLADRSVTLGDFEATRAYAQGSDPFDEVARSAALAAGETAVRDLAQGEMLRASMGLAGANQVLAAVQGTPNEGMGRAAVAEAEAKLAAAETALTNHHNSLPGPIFDVSSRAADAGVAASREMFDAIRLNFTVTPDRALEHPYYAVIAEIRDPGGKPGQASKWVYVKSLGALGAGESRKVLVYQSGFTPGFLLENCTVHIYDGAEELATNLSRKRVPLTEEEALEYRIIDYIGANKGRTLPATLATPVFAGPARAALTVDQLGQACHVRVDRGGRVVAVFRDAAGKRPLADPALEAALKTLRFRPALEAGKPAESIVPVTLGRLATR